MAGLLAELPWKQLTKQLWGGGKCQHSVETVDSQITLSIYQAFEAHELSRILQANLGIQIFFQLHEELMTVANMAYTTRKTSRGKLGGGISLKKIKCIPQKHLGSSFRSGSASKTY